MKLLATILLCVIVALCISFGLIGLTSFIGIVPGMLSFLYGIVGGMAGVTLFLDLKERWNV